MSEDEVAKSQAGARSLETSTSFTSASMASTGKEVVLPDTSPSKEDTPTIKSALPDNSAGPKRTFSNDRSFPSEKPTSITSSTSDLIEGEGGEWDLLSRKIKTWWEGQQSSTNWNQLVQPALIAIGLVLAITTFKIYGRLLNSIDQFPLASGLFELTGIIWMIKFTTSNLLRSNDRQSLLDRTKNRWRNFIGSKNDKL